MWELSTHSSGGKVSFGILAALWAASNGMSAITESLNVAYDITESRPWWKKRLVAVGLTIALSTLIIAALVLVLGGGHIADSLANSYGFGFVFSVLWKIVQWPLIIAAMLFAFALIYYFAPDFHKQSWVWITPGAVVGVALWLGISLAFRLYLHFFNSYSKTYGSLGAVIILMLWFYFTGLAILVGSEMNSEIENAAAEHGAVDAKDKGEKSPEQSSRAA
jgi:membrane protein